ncbi:MAG: tyrosine-type recombinase/integrase [Nakamurella sp.]
MSSIGHAVFHRARDFELTTANPAVGLRFRKLDQNDYRTRAKKPDGLDHGRAPTNDEVRHLMTALIADHRAGRQVGPRTRSSKGGRFSNPQDIADLSWLLFSVGCRVGEALALRWCDVNLTDSPAAVQVLRPSWDTRQPETATVTIPPDHLSINATLTSIIKQGLLRGMTKSPAGCRVVPLSPSAVAMLAARAEAFDMPWRTQPELPIFGALTGPAKFRDPTNVMNAIRFLYSEHGSTWFHSHGARKSVTTKLHRTGYDDNRIMRYMGWNNPATLQRYLDREQDLPEEMGNALDLGALPAISR